MGPAIRVLGLAIIFGGGLAVFSGTRAVFGIAETRAQAGRFSGAVLHAFTLLRAIGILMVLPGWHHLGFAAALVVAFVAGVFVDRRIRALRAELGGSTEGLAASDPRKRQFGALHGVSVLLLAVQVATAGIALALGLQ